VEFRVAFCSLPLFVDSPREKKHNGFAQFMFQNVWNQTRMCRLGFRWRFFTPPSPNSEKFALPKPFVAHDRSQKYNCGHHWQEWHVHCLLICGAVVSLFCECCFVVAAILWLIIPVCWSTLRYHLPEILMFSLQQNVTVEIGLLKSNKKTCQLWNRNLTMYVVFVFSDSIIT